MDNPVVLLHTEGNVEPFIPSTVSYNLQLNLRFASLRMWVKNTASFLKNFWNCCTTINRYLGYNEVI